MNHNPDAMLNAYRAGSDYARRIDSHARGARMIADGLSTIDEQIAFVAGYRATLRRMVDAGANVESAITANKINPAN